MYSRENTISEQTWSVELCRRQLERRVAAGMVSSRGGEWLIRCAAKNGAEPAELDGRS